MVQIVPHLVAGGCGRGRIVEFNLPLHHFFRKLSGNASMSTRRSTIKAVLAYARSNSFKVIHFPDKGGKAKKPGALCLRMLDEDANSWDIFSGNNLLARPRFPAA